MSGLAERAHRQRYERTYELQRRALCNEGPVTLIRLNRSRRRKLSLGVSSRGEYPRQ